MWFNIFSNGQPGSFEYLWLVKSELKGDRRVFSLNFVNHSFVRLEFHVLNVDLELIL